MKFLYILSIDLKSNTNYLEKKYIAKAIKVLIYQSSNFPSMFSIEQKYILAVVFIEVAPEENL